MFMGLINRFPLTHGKFYIRLQRLDIVCEAFTTGQKKDIWFLKQCNWTVLQQLSKDIVRVTHMYIYFFVLNRIADVYLSTTTRSERQRNEDILHVPGTLNLNEKCIILGDIDILLLK